MQLAALFTAFLLALLPYLPITTTSIPRYQAEDKLAPYVGTWVGHTPMGEFKVVLEERKNYRLLEGIFLDIVVGKHSYVTNAGVENKSSLGTNGVFTIRGGLDPNNLEQLSVIFTDNVNNKRVDVRLSFVKNDKSKLSWVIVGEREQWTFDPAIKVLPGVSVPSNLVLTKVN